MSSVRRPPNRLLQALPAEEFELLGPRLKLLPMARDTVLLETNAEPGHVVFPHDGVVAIIVSLLDGQTIAIAMIGRDGVVGATEALGIGPSLADAVVLFPGNASIVEPAELRAVAAQSPVLRDLLARHDQMMLAFAQQTAACNAVHSVEARLSRCLLRASDLGDGKALALTQEMLAHMIGVRRNAVSLVAHALQQTGVIRYSRGQIEVVNLEALQACSCECHAAVKARQASLMGTPPA